MAREPRNRLSNEPSLYLRQHATNPVDWYPWCDEALSRARSEDKPILLSVGYSACHWCHVMERECFENEDIAALMNEHFVCIKVDREERPDIDAIYMRAAQVMTGRGGWPMTVFLKPTLLPFYAGTYFPPVDRGRIPSFPRVLRAVVSAYRSKPDRVTETTERVSRYLRRSGASDPLVLDDAMLLDAGDRLTKSMDPEFGGFGRAPKFPGAMCLGLQMGLQRTNPEVERRQSLTMALDAMAAGGIYDHLGGGFHRYSVDREWRVPHFEKMLYDQALLVDAYRDAWLLFRDTRYREIALHTLEYVRREMQSPEGAFYAAQDADSAGEEGRYFRWNADEISSVVGPRDARVVLPFFGVTDAGDVEGGSVLRIAMDIAEIARLVDRPEAEVAIVIGRARRQLLERRGSRLPPAKDRKVLADWNGLMIAAMANAGRTFERPDFVECAKAAADHVLKILWPESRLFHFHSEGLTRVDGFLDDYAFLGRGVLELYAATQQSRYLDVAIRCAETLLERYEDQRDGAFFFSSRDSATILQTDKQFYDGAVPSGNAVAADVLYRLDAITGDGRYQRAADRALDSAAGMAVRNPYSGAAIFAAYHRRLVGYTTVVVYTSGRDSQLLQAALDVYAPEVTVIAAASDAKADDPPLLRAQRSRSILGDTAYVCRGGTCSLPLHTGEQLRECLVKATCGR